MRPELLDPLQSHPNLQATLLLAKKIYGLFEAGADYSEEIREMARNAGRIVSGFEVDSAFGSVSPEGFARTLLLEHKPVPTDITHAEMLELVERIFAPGRNKEGEIAYWIKCLKVSTGDERIDDLIFWPGEYFGDGDNSRDMTPEGILDTALARRKG
jgi:hypothetical protein